MIIGFDPKDTLKYLPEYGNNRGDDNPCVVDIHYVPYVKVREYARLFSVRTQETKTPQELLKISQTIQKKQFCDNVELISGFFIGEREITDPAEFYDSAPQALIVELIQGMENPMKLQEGLKENQEV